MSLSGHFPGISLPHPNWYDQKHGLYDRFGTTNGNKLYEKVLRGRILNGLPNSLVLHKNIKVVDPLTDQVLLYLSEAVLKPSSAKKFIVEDIDEETFKISLVHPPKLPPSFFLPQTLDEKPELEEYQKYKKGGKYRFAPHRYPTAAIKDVNLFLNPHMMPEETLRYLTGLPVEEVWKLTDDLTRAGLGSRVKSLSPICITLFYRMKLRLNLANAFLCTVFHLTKKTLANIFMMCITFHSSFANPDVKVWSRDNLTPEEENAAFESLCQDLDPYFSSLIGKIKVEFYV